MESQLEILWHVALAAVLGGVIGVERSLAGKPAGVRTQMLVCASAAFIMALGGVLLEEFGEDGTGAVRTDPVRILQAIIIGVSFLGAGTIFTNSQEERVEGLTTAATILFVTAVGVAVTLEKYVLAVGGTVLVLVVLAGLRWVETLIGVKDDRGDPGAS